MTKWIISPQGVDFFKLVVILKIRYRVLLYFPRLPEISGGLIDPSMKMKTGKYKCSPFDMGSLCSRKITVPV